MKSCKLCESESVKCVIPKGDSRKYYLCGNCNLISADPGNYPSRQSEIHRYLEHDNGIHNQGYVRFLEQVIKPACQYLNKEMNGLDYGCGPSPTLSKLLAKEGLKCYNYDPLFGFKLSLKRYDFIFSTECFEHFFYPAKDISKIDSLLKTGGILGIMTEQWESLDRFNNWYYKRDPTHVSFYHSRTIRFICNAYGYNIKYRDRNRVVIMEKL